MNREEAIRCLSVHSSTNGSGICTDKQHYEAKQMAIKALEQEPKTGTWEEEIDNSRRWDKVRFYCSECGSWQTYGKTDYCPSCGAKMVDPQERGDKCSKCEYYINPDYTRCKECGAERSDKE